MLNCSNNLLIKWLGPINFFKTILSWNRLIKSWTAEKQLQKKTDEYFYREYKKFNVVNLIFSSKILLKSKSVKL